LQAVRISQVDRRDVTTLIRPCQPSQPSARRIDPNSVLRWNRTDN
jgi:hypothetical protein